LEKETIGKRAWLMLKNLWWNNKPEKIKRELKRGGAETKATAADRGMVDKMTSVIADGRVTRGERRETVGRGGPNNE